MLTTGGIILIDADTIRLATALAHTVPGVVLELRCCNDDVLTVAHRRLDAQLDPCQLRAALLAVRRAGRPQLSDALESVHVRGALEDLGGGLFRSVGEGGDERWFASLLDPSTIEEELADLPVEVPDGAVRVGLCPDLELGVTVVRLVATDPAWAHRLDEVGFRALATCMVAETLQVALHPGRA